MADWFPHAAFPMRIICDTPLGRVSRVCDGHACARLYVEWYEAPASMPCPANPHGYDDSVAARSYSPPPLTCIGLRLPFLQTWFLQNSSVCHGNSSNTCSGGGGGGKGGGRRVGSGDKWRESSSGTRERYYAVMQEGSARVELRPQSVVVSLPWIEYTWSLDTAWVARVPTCTNDSSH